MTRALNPEGPKGSPVGASVQSNPPSPNADMDALVEKIGNELWVIERHFMHRSILRRLLERLTPADRKLLAEADGTMRVVPGYVALADVAAERQRQIDVEGYTADHDDEHDDGSIALAASCYAAGFRPLKKTKDAYTWSDAHSRYVQPEHQCAVYTDIWPWHNKWWKPSDRRRELVKAGALIVAEIERLDRANAPQEEQGNG